MESQPSNPVHELARGYLEKFEWADVDAIEIHFRMNLAVSAMLAATQRLLSRSGERRTRGWFGALRAIYFAPGQRLSQTEIGDHMNVAPPNVTYLIDGLEREGLVTRVQNEANRRITWVQLTNEGKRLCEEMVPAMTAHMGSLLDGFSTAEKQEFIAFLERFQKNSESSQLDE